MLNISAKAGDSILLYSNTGELIGTVTCRGTGGNEMLAGPRVDLEFRMPPGVVVLREALVLKETADTSKCPPSLLALFATPHAAPAA